MNSCRIPKQFSPSLPSQAKNSGQIIPVSPASQVNCFAVSSSIPKPNYERPTHGHPNYSFIPASLTPRLITPYTVKDPFGPFQSQSTSQFHPRKERSPYVKKPFLGLMFYIEPLMAHVKDPLALVMEYLPPNWHYIPKDPPKSIKFYKNIDRAGAGFIWRAQGMECRVSRALDTHRKPAITTDCHGNHGLHEEKKLIYGWLFVLY
ncbi:hypothetical protein SO802_025399 [Lithocarpus litseifolius]|uniref:Uncharacterized protein n=1 Tax=Lithocarpus litseifolius TaxID=425828 RepID=A0AAW2BWQ4_9ROSI